ncbi:unnamed protein product [Rotaria sp. Silwood1]|nr:unnamed protein product [Rotaria sp. Silwood1]
MESYYIILEKVIRYIYEARRDVEDLLKSLFRREENINYNKLRKCLLNLKSVEWIEKYRNGIYSDVIHNVEEQIIEHVKQMKDSAMEINIDLDNFDKIKHVYQIILQINTIKCLEKFIPDVVKDIDEVNNWFKEITNKESLKHYIIIVENTCKNIRSLFTSNCIFVLNDLEEFIRHYSTYIQQEMESSFETIKHSQNEDKKEIYEKVRILSNRLRELFEIKTKYSRVWSCFSNKNMIKYWQNELSYYLTDLSDEIEKITITKRINTLKDKLMIVKALSTLDRFREDEKFINIYHKYQNIFFIQINDAQKQVLDAITNNDYERVAFEIKALQLSNEIGEYFYQQAKQILNSRLHNLMEDTKTHVIILGNNLEIKEIKFIVDNLRRIQRAQQFVSEHVNELTELDAYVIEIKILIEERIIRFLEGVQVLISIHYFCKVDQKLVLIILVRSLLGNYCTEKVLNRMEEVKRYQDIVLTKDIIEKYSNMDITEYNLDPPTNLFAEVGEFSNTNPLYYGALNKIKEIIVKKFREELKQATLVQPPNLENNHIRRFELAVKYLPETIRIALEIDLKHCKDDINQLIQNNKNKLKTTVHLN